MCLLKLCSKADGVNLDKVNNLLPGGEWILLSAEENK